MKRFLFSLLAIAFLSSPVFGSIINFETVPGGTPSDQLPITDQYQYTHGVIFRTSNSSINPTLELRGTTDSGDGFLYDDGHTHDVEASGYSGLGLGNYFLRIGTGTYASGSMPDLIIDYVNPVSAASAQIWDIDAHSGYEQWSVTAYDNGSNVVASILSPKGIAPSLAGSLDALPWLWSFDNTEANISSIRLSYKGTKSSGIGLAFDNFSPSSPSPVPEPATMFLLGSGLVGLVGFRKKNKK